MNEDLDIQAMRAMGGYWYLASPYSKYPDGMKAAFRLACGAAAWLVLHGLPVFCPIAHSHPVAEYGGISPADHEIWLPADAPLMAAATGLIVLMLPTWEDSVGVAFELNHFTLDAKPVRYMEWPR